MSFVQYVLLDGLTLSQSVASELGGDGLSRNDHLTCQKERKKKRRRMRLPCRLSRTVCASHGIGWPYLVLPFSSPPSIVIVYVHTFIFLMAVNKGRGMKVLLKNKSLFLKIRKINLWWRRMTYIVEVIRTKLTNDGGGGSFMLTGGRNTLKTGLLFLHSFIYFSLSRRWSSEPIALLHSLVCKCSLSRF